MFENLTERLTKTIQHLRGQARLTEENMADALRDVRMALLEADVSLPVVREFVEEVKTKALGQEVITQLNPGQALIKLVHGELVHIMGDANETLNLKAQPPAVVLMAGLQGSGKTTTTAKLARLLKERERKKVLVVSCDIYRPAAIEQLKTLANSLDIAWFPSKANQEPVEIAKAAKEYAKTQFFDVLIVDTAGRLHIDEAMMNEIKAINAAVNPIETLFVVDSMTGQDAVTTAKAFHDTLPLTGVVLTKTDGDARGGAALSIRHVTGKPIKFLGVGEKTEALEPFHPERVASRILGMGDVLSLVEQIEQKVDHDKVAKLEEKFKKGKAFNLDDFSVQLEQMLSMGGVSAFMDKIPGISSISSQVRDQVNDAQIKRNIAIISSMTKKERRYPDLIKGSHRRRIAMGSGTQVQDVNRLLKQFEQMQRAMKQFSKGGIGKMMQGIRGRMGR